nr:MAG TPA: minor capsid protein [Caudoviricetes sp.]
MNKAQKEVQQAQLNDEKKVIKLLERVYEQAKKDCEQKIRELSARTDLENLQSIIYQKEYQQIMVDQIESILYDLHEGQFTTIADYLQQSYINGYVGMYYDLHLSGIPLVIPIQQDQVVKALKTNSKLSSGLYKRLGEDVDYLKRSIRAELSRGIASGSTWNEMALRIAKGMNSPFRKAYNNAIRIARTEGHRIQNEAALDGQHGAKKKGADIVKQWDSTLDGRTRDEHRECDGQIREIDEPFDVGGEKMQAPGVGGSARNVCNCRCCLLQRAKWALDEKELETLKERAEFFGLDKTDDFEEFKKKYLESVEKGRYSDIIESDLGKFKKKLRNDSEMTSEYYACLKDKFSHGTENAKRLFIKFVGDNSVEDAFYENTAHYNIRTKKISMHYGADLNNPRGAGITWFHEHGHLIDDLSGNMSNDKYFLQLLENDSLSYRIAYGKAHHLKTFDKVDKAIGGELKDMRKHSAISDIFDGVTQGNIIGCASHSKEYWENRDNVTSEAFAHMFEAQFDKERYEQMEKYFPNALKYFEKKIKEAL